MKTVDWHPTKGVIASASKDALVKLWDARGPPAALATLHGHKATVMKVCHEALLLSLCWKSCCLITGSNKRIFKTYTQEWPQLTAVADISGHLLLRCVLLLTSSCLSAPGSTPFMSCRIY